MMPWRPMGLPITINSSLSLNFQMPKCSGDLSFLQKDGTVKSHAAAWISNMNGFGNIEKIDVLGNNVLNKIFLAPRVYILQSARNFFRGFKSGWQRNLHISGLKVEGIPWITDSFKDWRSPSVESLLNKWAYGNIEWQLETVMREVGAVALSRMDGTSETEREEITRYFALTKPKQKQFWEDVFKGESIESLIDGEPSGRLADMRNDDIAMLMQEDLGGPSTDSQIANMNDVKRSMVERKETNETEDMALSDSQDTGDVESSRENKDDEEELHEVDGFVGQFANIDTLGLADLHYDEFNFDELNFDELN